MCISLVIFLISSTYLIVKVAISPLFSNLQNLRNEFHKFNNNVENDNHQRFFELELMNTALQEKYKEQKDLTESLQEQLSAEILIKKEKENLLIHQSKSASDAAPAPHPDRTQPATVPDKALAVAVKPSSPPTAPQSLVAHVFQPHRRQHRHPAQPSAAQPPTSHRSYQPLRNYQKKSSNAHVSHAHLPAEVVPTNHLDSDVRSFDFPKLSQCFFCSLLVIAFTFDFHCPEQLSESGGNQNIHDLKEKPHV